MSPEQGIDTPDQTVVTDNSATTETSQTAEQTTADPAAAAGQTPEARQAAEEKRTRWRDEYFKAQDRERQKDRLISDLIARMPGQQAQQPAATQKGDWRSENRAPREEDFPGDYAAYLQATLDHKLDQRLSAAERQRQEKAQQWQQAERQQAFATKVQKGIEKYPDFETVALSDEVPVTDAMAQAMFDSDHFTEIAYHLGKNPKEAARIAALSPWAAAREIGKIEDRISQSQGKGATAAPAPPRTVGASGSSAPTVHDDDMPIDEWMARENKRDAERRKRR